MKRLLFILAMTGLMTACNNDAKKEEPKTGDTAAVTDKPAPPPEPVAPAIKDSVMQFKDGKVMIMLGGTWSALTATVTTTNGRKVSPDGEVSKGKVKRKMEEGMMIDKDGQMMDKDGKVMDTTGWE